MKKISLSSVKEFLTRDEMKAISGGSGNVETCIYYSGCSSRCLERKATTAGWQYFCTYCCVAS